MDAVVSVSHGALGPLLGKLNTLLSDECARLGGVRRDIRSLTSELSNMQAALHKYASLDDPDIQVKAWIAELRELAYDIEDCIDKFIHQLGANDEQLGTSGIKDFFRKSTRGLKTLGSRHKIAGEIEELKARVISVRDQKNSYKLDDTFCSSSRNKSTVDPRLAALFAEKNHLVGIEGPRDELVNWLDVESSSLKRRKVLSIVGFGGLGKTTLANEDIIHQMPIKDGFLKDIDTWDEKKFIHKLRELLVDKRYLVIIDDVWSVLAWNDIKLAFPENDCSSRIIVTTRISEVGQSCCSNNGIDRNYEMEPLSEVHSRRLFCKRIFCTDEDGCPDSLQEVSRDILKKCGGLPLAIISISGLLANKPVIKEEWVKVKESIGFALDKNSNLEGMKSILSLSYHDLPNYLKTCMLYLSIFPEDHIIERNMLLWRWIAEGFISEDYGHKMEDVAESYFYELINKSLVQPVDIGFDGKARACRVHDIMLELISSKAIEENFITVLAEQTGQTNSCGCVRRLSIHGTVNYLSTVLANKDLRHVRSLTCFGGDKEFLPRLARFEALRVLDYGLVDFEGYDLENIGKLFQLKYLRLCDWNLSRVPTQIAKLQNLLTLDLSETNVEELPTEFCRLTKLLHLHGNSSKLKVPKGIGNMRNLQVLRGINISNSSASAVAELGALPVLRDLSIRLSYEPRECKPIEEMFLTSLCKLSSYKLQSLHIFGGTSYEFLDRWFPLPRFLRLFYMNTNYCIPHFPKWIKPDLTNIAYLNINIGEMREEDMKTLGDLPGLLCLEVYMDRDPSEQLTVKSMGFPCLKKFVLVCGLFVYGGAYFTFEKGAMPKLEKLRLPFHVLMAKSHGFYLGIKNLSCLKEAVVRMYRGGANHSDTEAATAAIRSEASANPNHPRLTIIEEYAEEDRGDEGAKDEQGGVTEN
ncbi:disease resistance protein Pik-2-like isoform X2 [Oryza brachyantha]|uniref:disease resistance protein Pik-2-like isoform X2 n=1 Tax=Oryza brachyantha TaxID=4533 RepID=UPI001ADA0C23|nr:disease resistance protein Pik-2-like isoform X2 [Oryza brachyantha]